MILAAAVNLGLEAIKGGAEREVSGWTGGHDLSEFGTQQACVGVTGRDILPVSVRLFPG